MPLTSEALYTCEASFTFVLQSRFANAEIARDACDAGMCYRDLCERGRVIHDAAPLNLSQPAERPSGPHWRAALAALPGS